MLPPLAQRFVGLTNGATAVNVLSDLVTPDECWRVEQIVLSNTSGEAVTVVLSVVAGAFSDVLDRRTSVADGEAVRLIGPFYLGEQQRVQATVTGSLLTGPVVLTVHGRRLGLEEYAGTPPAERLTE